jgi:hypothetical protein
MADVKFHQVVGHTRSSQKPKKTPLELVAVPIEKQSD